MEELSVDTPLEAPTTWDGMLPPLPEIPDLPTTIRTRHLRCAGECGRRPSYRLPGCKAIGSRASWYCAQCSPPEAVRPQARCRGGCGRRGDFSTNRSRQCCEECAPRLPLAVPCIAECGRKGTYLHTDGLNYCGVCRPARAQRRSRLCACGTLGSYQDANGEVYCGPCRPSAAVRTHGMCVTCQERRGSFLVAGQRYCAGCSPEPRPPRRPYRRRKARE